MGLFILTSATIHMVATLLSVISSFFPKMADAKEERTFLMVKVDGVQRGLVGEIVSRFEKKGFKLVGAKLTQATEEHMRTHYESLKHLPFYDKLCKFASSGPVFAMVWEGKGVVKTGRVMLGETDPAKSLPGTIRGDFCIDIGRNIIHGSDAVETAKQEIKLWFKEDELMSWNPSAYCNIYE